MNVAGTIGTNSFIKNRLSTIEFHHKNSASGADRKYTFPVESIRVQWIRWTPSELLSTPSYKHEWEFF